MLLKQRPPRLHRQSATTAEDFAHLDRRGIALLRWLHAHRIQFVLVGPVAQAIRGIEHETGPVTIVPAPYARNYVRLSRALWSAHARLRVAGESTADTVPFKMTEEKLADGQLWALRCGEHDLDIECHLDGPSHYQELLYEAGRFDLADDLSVEVASPEDLEHYEHLRRTGSAPEIRISRAATVEHTA